MLSPVLSSACALFAQKHRGVGYRSSSLGARTRHTCHQHFACKPFSFSRLRTLSVTAGTVAFGVHFARQSAASHSGSLATVSLSPFFSQISQTPSANSFACTHFRKTPRGWGYDPVWQLSFSLEHGFRRAAKFLGINAAAAAEEPISKLPHRLLYPLRRYGREIQKG